MHNCIAGYLKRFRRVLKKPHQPTAFNESLTRDHAFSALTLNADPQYREVSRTPEVHPFAVSERHKYTI